MRPDQSVLSALQEELHGDGDAPHTECLVPAVSHGHVTAVYSRLGARRKTSLSWPGKQIIVTLTESYNLHLIHLQCQLTFTRI